MDSTQKKRGTFAQRMKAFYEKIKIFYRKADEASPFKAWLILLGVAAASLIFVLLPFLFRGTYTVWTELAGDAATQFLTFLTHIKQTGWFKAIGNYDFYMGLGADYLSSLSFYSLFDPFNVFYFILPFGDLMNYTITMALKQFACAVTMFAYLRYKKVKNSRAILLSVAYMVTGFVAFTFVRHYNLAVGPIYFPLAILGVEKLHKKETPYVFIAAVFLCLCSNFYVFFSLSVFVVVYAISYYFYDNKLRGVKCTVGGFFARLVPIGLYYLLGVALAGILLFPNLYGYLHAARNGSKGLDFFSFDVFIAQMCSLVLPVPGRNYTSLGLNVANTALALYALFKKDKNTRLYGIFVIVLTVGYLLPVFGYAMNIFNYSNNRWSYGLSFFVYVMIAVQSKDGDEEVYDEKTAKKINVSFIVYVALMLASGLPALTSFMGLEQWYFVLLSVVIAGGIGYGTYVLCRKVWKGKVPRFFKKVYQPTMLFTLGFALAVVSTFGFYIVYSGQHEGKERYSLLFSREEQYVAGLNGEEYFRTDSMTSSEWYYNFSTRGINNGYYGTALYNSVADGGVYEFFAENGVYNPAQNLGTCGLDERYALQSLLSVRYTYDKLGGVYGFNKTEGYEYLYENTNYVPLGFVTDKTYSREYYLEQEVLERQYLLLNGVVLDGAAGSADGTYLPSLEKKGVFGEGAGSQFLTKTKRTFTLDAKEYRGKEVYFVIRGVDEVHKGTKIDVSCNGKTKQYYYANKGNLMYSENRDVYLNFGVVDESVETLEFSVYISSGAASVGFDTLEIHSAAAASQAAAIENMQAAAHLENVTLESNALKGTIRSAEDGYMLLTIPYSEGWTAYVNGERVDVYKADTAFMAIEIKGSEKEQTVEFRYETPWLGFGKLVSLAGAGILGIVAAGDTTYRIVKSVLKKRKEKEITDISEEK